LKQFYTTLKLYSFHDQNITIKFNSLFQAFAITFIQKSIWY